MKFRSIVTTASLALALLLSTGAARAQYQVTNLVSNQEGVAKHTDPLLLNPWGIVHGPGGPYWVSDNTSGWSTLYTGSGSKESLKIVVPNAAQSGPGSPTGIVFNASSDFMIQGSKAIFLFATLDGTISGWAPGVDFGSSIVAVTNPGAVYTGLANTSKASGNLLFAADNANNKVDIYDGTFKFVKSFTDTTLPAGFAPFGIQDFGGLLYVSFANTSGAAGGYIDIFAEDGTLLKQLSSGTPLNQPWGLAIAPNNFGPFSNTLLVSNNTNSGTINAFNAVNGQYIGTLKDTSGEVIHINQIWGIEFGDGLGKNGGISQLFFTAGPDNGLAGLFGRIDFK